MELNYRLLSSDKIEEFISNFNKGELLKLLNVVTLYKDIYKNEDVLVFYEDFSTQALNKINSESKDDKFELEEFIDKICSMKYEFITFLEDIFSGVHNYRGSSQNYEIGYYSFVLRCLKDSYIYRFKKMNIDYSNITLEQALLLLDSTTRDMYAISIGLDPDTITPLDVFNYYHDDKYRKKVK